MNEPVWAEFVRRFPWAAGLSGEALDEAIAAHWFDSDPVDIAHMYKRMALACQAHSASPAKWPNE